jgi:hypothetical protein
MRFEIHFHNADEDFVASARDVGTWEVETRNDEPVCPRIASIVCGS